MSYNDNASTSTVPPFPFGVRLGIVFIVQSACLSALAVSFLLLYIGVWHHLTNFFEMSLTRLHIQYSAITVKQGASRKWTVSTHIHYYFVNLLISDLVQAIGRSCNIWVIVRLTVLQGGIMSVKWIVDSVGILPCIFLHLTWTLLLFYSELRLVHFVPPRVSSPFVEAYKGLTILLRNFQTSWWCWGCLDVNNFIFLWLDSTLTLWSYISQNSGKSGRNALPFQ